ncbi:MAG: dihydrofolate reductase family protein [Rhizobacter sp.]|nr:dihydrofolate reductase family protein [Ferruginibacter sp.]
MLEKVDLLLLGGGMWEEYRDYWKKALHEKGFSANELKYAQWAEKTQHIIFSSTLTEAGWQNARLEKVDELEAFVAQIKAGPGGAIQIVGGAQFAQGMIDTGLVDEYRIFVNPVIVGKGKSFFHQLQTRHNLKRNEVILMDSGLVVLSYKQLDSDDAENVKGAKRRE